MGAGGSIWADRVRLTAPPAGTAIAGSLLNLDTVNLGLAQYGVVGGGGAGQLLLQSITNVGARIGDRLRLTAEGTGFTVVSAAPGGALGTFLTPGLRNLVLGSSRDAIDVVFNGSQWVVVGYQSVGTTNFANQYLAFIQTAASAIISSAGGGVPLAESSFSVNFPIPANAMVVGSSLRISAMVVCTTSGGDASLARLRIGPTTAPPSGQILAQPLAAGTILLANGYTILTAEIVFRASGAGATVTGHGRATSALNPGAPFESGVALQSLVAQAAANDVPLFVHATIQVLVGVAVNSYRLEYLSVLQA